MVGDSRGSQTIVTPISASLGTSSLKCTHQLRSGVPMLSHSKNWNCTQHTAHKFRQGCTLGMDL